MVTKRYMILGIDMAVNLLRPGAKWEWTGGVGFTRWEDPRPKPSQEEVMETIEKIKAFEDSSIRSGCLSRLRKLRKTKRRLNRRWHRDYAQPVSNACIVP
jgi:hypothetical protein